MMKFSLLLASVAILAMQSPAGASERYRTAPPLVVSPDLSAPWVMQLRRGPDGAPRAALAAPRRPLPRLAQQPAPQRKLAKRGVVASQPVQLAAAIAPANPKPRMDDAFLPQSVSYAGSEKPGTIVIDTASKFLYLVEAGGSARRYGVGVGKEGFLWSGTQKITRKAEWPDWRPPAEMIARERVKGRILPALMVGGPENPLGARAMYLGSTLYRIHGTNAPWTIGQNVSSGCIRLRNEDVVDLFERVKVGTTVIVR